MVSKKYFFSSKSHIVLKPPKLDTDLAKSFSNSTFFFRALIFRISDFFGGISDRFINMSSIWTISQSRTWFSLSLTLTTRFGQLLPSLKVAFAVSFVAAQALTNPAEHWFIYL